MHKILIRSGGRERMLEAAPGETLLSVLQRAGVPVSAPCGGQGRCGKCRVLLQKDGAEQTVLACRAKADGDCAVTLETQHGGAIVGAQHENDEYDDYYYDRRRRCDYYD